MITSNKISILIIEDDPIISHDISIILKKNDYLINGIAHSAMKAINHLATNKPDFIILDIHLGKGDTGIDVAKVIHEKYKLPYIFLTSFSDKDTLQAAQEHGPYGYLVKPFQEATLLATISITLSNHQNSVKGLNFEKIDVKLTNQEQRLCTELYKGLSYQEISEALNVSINTVRYHVKNLYLKFDVNARAELVARLLE